MSSPTASPSTNTALKLSRTTASGWLIGTIAGCTRTPIVAVVRVALGDREQLDDVAEPVGEGDVGGGDAC